MNKFESYGVNFEVIPVGYGFDKFSKDDESFITCLLRILGFIASKDGVVNLQEFVAMQQLIEKFECSSSASMILISAVSTRTDLSYKDLIVKLKRSASGIDGLVLRQAFALSTPLLQCQGTDSRRLAIELAQALGIELSSVELAVFPEETKAGISSIATSIINRVRGDDFTLIIDEAQRIVGGSWVHELSLEYKSGKIKKEDLLGKIRDELIVLKEDIDNYEEGFDNLKGSFVVPNEAAAIYELRRQTEIRIHILRERVGLLKKHLSEEIDEAICDAGNSFELDVLRRLRNDSGRKSIVWSDVARSMGKEIELKLTRIVSRYEESLSVLEHEISNYQDQLAKTRSLIMDRVHHHAVSAKAPSLRLRTRVAFAMNDLASATLVTEFLVGSGWAMAIGGKLVAISSLTVLTPMLPYIAAATLTSIFVKYLSSIGSYKEKEIEAKRKDLEQEMRARLNSARDRFHEQIDKIESAFIQHARSSLMGLVIEAEASERYISSAQQIVNHIINENRKKLLLLQSRVEGVLQTM
ncbi:hypothetical protein [Chitinilyticum aquatile]|uniref:hypothetical protein n=1 Tax=Chitinilyticum aquatile TaxID=362520 RepID=UPI0003F8846C|nr:hypothetical protein [Chitinilyticum aquatile]